MEFTLPIFQRKEPFHEDWVDTEDTVFMEELYKYVSKATPYVRRMLAGEVLHFDGIAYRILPGEKNENTL